MHPVPPTPTPTLVSRLLLEVGYMVHKVTKITGSVLEGQDLAVSQRGRL